MPDSSHAQKPRHLPELLAPAGSPEAFRAAVAAGADAVYLSGKNFGARKSAPNFTDAEIEAAINFAHTRNVRVYVTVNTLIHDRELAGVASYLIWLYSIGADAVLVQDTGVAALAREIVPDLPLHASTQMTIHNTAGVEWAAEQGFSRVVLSRELSLDEIEEIAKKTRNTGIGLEVFAHGALCYCYSGQCLLSSMIGGRSGNRGMCAQPCRKPYTLVYGEQDAYGRPTGLTGIPSSEPFLLSAKDLCTYQHLPELVRSPVASLKIEGRMRSPEYVAIVVSTYRKALDAIAAGSYNSSPGSVRDLLLAFNRGFTSGYLFGDSHATLMSRDAPDNRGICIGVVTGSDEKSGTVVIRLNGTAIPASGDGLLFSHPKRPGDEWGFSLNNAPLEREKGGIAILVPHPVRKGARVYITFSRDLESRARQIIAHPPAGLRQRVPIDLTVQVGAGGRLAFDGVINPGTKREIRLSYQPGLCLEPARSRPLTRDQWEQQMKKTGGTSFVIRNFSLASTGDLFAPLAGLNRVRREFLTRAEEVLIASSRPSKEAVELAMQRGKMRDLRGSARASGIPGDLPSPVLHLAVFADSLDAVSSAAKAGCDVVCFEPEVTSPKHHCGKTTVHQTVESQLATALGICRDAKVRLVWKFPRITRDNYLKTILPLVPTLFNQGISEIMVENPGTARALLRVEPSLSISGSTGLNIFNHEAVRHHSPQFALLTLSPELSRDELRDLIRTARSLGSATGLALIVQGTGEAMVSDDCILQTLLRCEAGKRMPAGAAFLGISDDTGHCFPVRVDGECRTHIGNAREICLVDHLPDLMQMGISEVVIDARGRTAAYAREMTRMYREAVEYTTKGIAQKDPRFERLKEQVRQIALVGITAGHFIRGLKE